MGFLRVFLAASISFVTFTPLAAQADGSKCIKQVRSQGYFITDIDSDWDRPYDNFDVMKDGKEYDLWVNKNSCKIEHKILDSRYDRYNK